MRIGCEKVIYHVLNTVEIPHGLVWHAVMLGAIFNLQIKLFNFNEQTTKLFRSQLPSIRSYLISNMIQKTIKNTNLNLRSHSLRTYKCQRMHNIWRGSRDKAATKF